MKDMQREIEKVWFISKPGDERRFSTTTAPSPEWAASLKSQGFKILRVEFFLPEGWDSSDETVGGRLQGE